MNTESLSSKIRSSSFFIKQDAFPRERFYLALSAALLAVVLAAAGCGSGAAQKESPAPASSKPQSTAAGTPAAAESLVLVTDRLDIDFSKHIVTFIELGADKCIPCKAMQPIMKEIAVEYEGQVQVVFYDVWKNPEPARKYGIQLIPTQVFIDKTGREVFRHVGLFPKDELVAFLKKQGVR
ncbi:MAG: thioredoxin family protein [Candidatus Aminicenantes bacterium]|nr:thioredoxin family protein [Candidatus Aminicenantes bacterium]